MDAFQPLLDGLVAHATATMLVVAMIAIGYLYRARDNDHTAFLALIMKKEEEHRATLEKVLPVAENLNQSVTLLARLIDHKE